jgi:hypothetical protein
MGLRIKSGHKSKVSGDKGIGSELITLLIIYGIIIVWILNFNI